jgi:hypothetical protein
LTICRADQVDPSFASRKISAWRTRRASRAFIRFSPSLGIFWNCGMKFPAGPLRICVQEFEIRLAPVLERTASKTARGYLNCHASSEPVITVNPPAEAATYSIGRHLRNDTGSRAAGHFHAWPLRFRMAIDKSSPLSLPIHVPSSGGRACRALRISESVALRVLCSNCALSPAPQRDCRSGRDSQLFSCGGDTPHIRDDSSSQ